MKLPIGLAVCVCFCAATAQARISSVYGPGSASCSEWTIARQRHTDQELGFVYWVGGYVSGFNAFAADDAFGAQMPGHVTGTSDMYGMAAWVDNYCQQNPLDSVVQATTALIKTLMVRKN